MTELAPPSGEVKHVFDAFDASVRERLLVLRTLIYETAQETPEVGAITETLKWGEPSYAPAKPKIGSSVRLGVSKTSPGDCALFFICNTSLFDEFRSLYAEQLRFDGNRTILIHSEETLPLDPLKHCITLALTYHINKQRLK